MFSRIARSNPLKTARWLSTEAATPSTSTIQPPPVPSSSSTPSELSQSTPSKPTKSNPSQSKLSQAVFEKQDPLPVKKGVHVATLQLRSYTNSLESLTFFTSFALRAARALGLPTSNVISLPTATTLWTTPRGPFAHKKSQENFWRKEHKRAIKVYDGNEKIVSAWLAFLRKEALGGVGMKAQVFTYRELGWGQKMVTEEGLRMSAIEGSGREASQEDVEATAKLLQAEIEQEIEQELKDQGEPEVATPPTPVEAEEVKA